MGFLGIVLALALLVGLAFRGWSVLLLAPAAALVAAGFSGEPLLASLTQRFMPGAAGFLAQFFPLFLLGALFGKLMDDSGSVAAIARTLTQRLGARRAVPAVVLAGAVVTYGGVSLFVAFFVLVPMAKAVFRAADAPRRLMPAALILGTSTFTMTALPGSPAIQNAIPMPFFGTTPYAAPGLGLLAAAVMLAGGLAWLSYAQGRARKAGEGYGGVEREVPGAGDPEVRERAVAARDFDTAEIERGAAAASAPGFLAAVAPLAVVIAVNLLMSLAVLPRIDAAFLAEPRWGGATLSDVAGVWSVAAALAAGTAALVAIHWKRLSNLKRSMDAGANASVLPALSVCSLVGFGAVIAALPAFGLVRDAVLDLPGGPLVSLAAATNVVAALTGSASGGLTIALEALGPTYADLAARHAVDPALLHRVAVIGSGTLDILPHNGAVVSLLALCGCGHKESYGDIVMVGIMPSVAALAVVIAAGPMLGAF
jgi:hypothetical protein